MTTTNRMSIKFAGAAGQGVESNGDLLARTLSRSGLHLYARKEYESRIRGGLNYYHVFVDSQPLYTHRQGCDLLLAQTTEAVEVHGGEVRSGGGVIYDEGMKVDTAALEARGVRPMPVPLNKIAKEIGGRPVMAGAASVAAALALTGFPQERLNDTFQRQFGKKGEKVVAGNRAVAKAAYDYALEHYAAGFEPRLEPIDGQPDRLYIEGNPALAYGALAGGVNLVAGYPMTPGTSVMEWLATHGKQHGVLVKHSEDEISGLNMVIGAAYNGARAMTSTSGGGFALMVEALSLAGMTETPVVIVLAQRPGPSTGLATRTEQGDLHFALRAGHGEFPRILLAPTTIEECFEAGWRAFNLAEKYQTPVIILTDHYMATSSRTIDTDAFDLDAVSIDRGEFLDGAALDALEEPYERHAVTESGISPRAVPGHPKAVYTITGNEHRESGVLTEDADNRNAQHSKRLRKAETAAREMKLPTWHGPEGAERTLVCWGLSAGSTRAAVDELVAAGQSVNALVFSDLWPLDWDAVNAELAKATALITVEGNATAQWAEILRGKGAPPFAGQILKFDGRPLSPEFILAALEEVQS